MSLIELSSHIRNKERKTPTDEYSDSLYCSIRYQVLAEHSQVPGEAGIGAREATDLAGIKARGFRLPGKAPSIGVRNVTPRLVADTLVVLGARHGSTLLSLSSCPGPVAKTIRQNDVFKVIKNTLKSSRKCNYCTWSLILPSWQPRVVSNCGLWVGLDFIWPYLPCFASVSTLFRTVVYVVGASCCRWRDMYSMMSRCTSNPGSSRATEKCVLFLFFSPINDHEKRIFGPISEKPFSDNIF